MKSVYTTLLFCVLASLVSGASIPQKRMNDGKYSPDKVVWYDEYHHGGGPGTGHGGGHGHEGEHGGGGGGGGHEGGHEGGNGGDGGHGGDDGHCRDDCGGETGGGVKDPGTTDPGTTDPGTTDPGTMDPDIPDPTGSDPDSEPVNPAIVELIDATENAGPWPEIVDYSDDASDEDVSVSDFVPYDYCIPESDGGNDTSQYRGSDVPDQIDQDYCIDTYGDADVRGQFPGSNETTSTNTNTTDIPSPGNDTSVSRRSQFLKRTYADTDATGTMNRWKRGSVISVCVERNNAYMVNYGSPSKRLRASAVVNGATIRAINLWNAGLDARYISFEHVDDCRDAVFKVVAVDRLSPSGKALATAPLPPRGSAGNRFREVYVWSASFRDNYQNVLTATMSHELGHTIGLAHENCNSIEQGCEAITEETRTSIMRATISNSSSIQIRGPTSADIAGTNLYYSLGAGAQSDPTIVLWPATRGALINYPPLPKCQWFLGVCYY